MELFDGVHSYELDYAAFEGDNALCIHVIETETATVQFGAGHENTADEASEITRDHEVDVVIPEHGDIDHYGGIPTLYEHLQNPPEIAVPAGDIEWIREYGIEPDHKLVGGETYWDVEAIDTPGHTPGNMAFQYGDVLVAGDTLIGADFSPLTADGWTGAFGLAPPSRNTGGDERAIESVSLLLNYEFSHVLVSHGSNVLQDGREEIQKLVADLAAGVKRVEF